MGRRCGHVHSCALYGIDGLLVEIEVTILPGLPSFEIVGLGDSAVRESRNRVHAAIRNNGYEFPASRVTASYAPAWLRKEGSAFDLPLALAILIASGQISSPAEPVCAFGELSLTGQVRTVPGAICRASTCTEHQFRILFVPAGNAAEARLAAPRSCFPVSGLCEAVRLLAKLDEIDRTGKLPDLCQESAVSAFANPAGQPQEICQAKMEIQSIAGQKKAIRALQIAAAGRHNLLLLGSPGCGKTALASALPSLLPPLGEAEAMLVTRIYSVSGLLKEGSGLIRQRPFRAPHHSISRPALVGGGAVPVPGEISLAHHGVLFLDEMTEFQPDVLDMLRQPLEDRNVQLVRLRHSITYPADFLLIGAANPCRCGEYLEPTAACRCPAISVKQHLGRLSGPLLDRMDLTVEMTRLSEEELRQSVQAESQCGDQAGSLARGILKCWQIQKQRCRLHGLPETANGRISPVRLAETLDLPDQAIAYAARSAARLNLTARAYHKVLRVARTIADLAESRQVGEEHVAEALQYRLRWPD